MKKFVCLILAASMLLSLCACGQSAGSTGDVSAQPDGASEEPAAEENAGSAEDDLDDDLNALDALGDIETDKGLFNVTLTIPADFVDEGTTQDSLDQQAKKSGWRSATLNEDGSVTYVITKAQHKEMMDGVRETIDTAIKEMIGSEDYPSITAIDVNDDYTQFKVTLSDDEMGLMDAFSTLAFYMYGAMYHVFNGTEAGNISVQYINGSTGEVIEEANSADMAAETDTAG